MRDLLSGNQAIARGAYEAGVTVASGYPGTPSTEILESLVKIGDNEVYCEWSPNEKVAFEVAAGAAQSGARCLVTMKHVGLNVAADPLITLAHVGVIGGFVFCVADDPGMHSSQNEQDSRHYARLAKIPMLEPADSLEALNFTKIAFEISEQFNTPVMLRSNTRISHSRSLVDIGERTLPNRKIRFEQDPPRLVPIPGYARQMRIRLEDRLDKLKQAAESSPLNHIHRRDRKFGIITSSISYQYVEEAFPKASILKLGFVYPFPDKLIREFADGVENILIVEELDDILEQHVKALGIACEGRKYISGIGELSTLHLRIAHAKMEGREVNIPQPVPQAADLPPRPPTLCAGCPHRGIFHALKQFDIVLTGDIGCYSLGVLPPLSRLDSILCMGAGISMAHGVDKARDERKVVGMVGDSTFFHSGITGLIDIAYNKGASIIVVVDNRTTAMTGHQDHPGTGKTLMGTPTHAVSIENIGKACGIKRVFTVDPFDADACIKLIERELDENEPTLIISKSPCILSERPKDFTPRVIDTDQCINCGNCVELGCPAIEIIDGYPSINPMTCLGCGLCDSVCELQLITPREDK